MKGTGCGRTETTVEVAATVGILSDHVCVASAYSGHHFMSFATVMVCPYLSMHFYFI